MTYAVRVDERVARELRRLPAADAETLLDKIESLSRNPRPRGARKLVNQPGWRVRVGSYRILYETDDRDKLVTIYRAGHRKDVYRRG